MSVKVNAMSMKINSGILLGRVKREAPLVHHLTNWVTISDCAQAVKSLGASPIMAHALEEVGDIAGISSALVLNIGTLTTEFVEAMHIAIRVAHKRKIPVVLDICGAGATRFRNKKCRELINTASIDIIKGNVSEVASLSDKNVRTKGVDSTEVTSDIQELALKSAANNKCVVVVTAAEDIVTDGRVLLKVNNGDKIMSSVVGTGCMAASIIGTFAAVEKDLIKASTAGLVCFEVASEIAAAKSKGPGSFKEALFDALYLVTPKALNKRQRIT